MESTRDKQNFCLTFLELGRYLDTEQTRLPPVSRKTFSLDEEEEEEGTL